MRVKLLKSRAASAAENMALDEALLDYVTEDGSAALPWLRSYSWERTTVSFGYFQRPEREIDLSRARDLGLELVKRPTGGKALIHGDELTYSVVLPAACKLCKLSVAESHQILAKALVKALTRFDLSAELSKPALARRASRDGRIPCFAEHLAESVVIDGRKVAGSAQLRRKGALLQHGSIVRSMDAKLHDELFASAAKGLEQRASGLDSFLEVLPSLDELADTVLESLLEALEAVVVEKVETLPPWVETRKNRLVAEKYARLDGSIRQEEKSI